MDLCDAARSINPLYLFFLPLRLFSFSPLTVTPLFPFSPGHQINSRYTSSTCFFPANAHWHLHKYSTEEQDEQGVLSLPLASISLLYKPPPPPQISSQPPLLHALMCRGRAF